MGKTGTTCEQSGVYKCPKCEKENIKNEIPLAEGNTFPPCNKHGSVDWVLVRRA